MEDLRRVFFHELGHFVAHEMNQRYYSGTGIRSITIQPHYLGDHLFVGEANINLSDDERERMAPPLKYLPEYLASSTYGCIFQAYYQKTKLSNCLKVNGEDDMTKWHGSLLANSLEYHNADVAVAEEQYFDLLVQKRALDTMMMLNPENYLVEEGNQRYVVDIDRLRIDTDAFIDFHIEYYNTLILDYKNILLSGHS